MLMGLTPMPSWARKTSTFERDVMATMSGRFRLCGEKRDSSVHVVDRFFTVGERRRDRIHPTFDAQFALGLATLHAIC